MKELAGLALGALLALAGCSTNHRLITPDHEAREIISPEARPGGCSPCMYSVCGDADSYPPGGWRAHHKGVEYIFDCDECRTRFNAKPELYSDR